MAPTPRRFSIGVLAALLLASCSAGKPTLPAGEGVSANLAAPELPNACPSQNANRGQARSLGREATAAERETMLQFFRQSPTGRTMVDQFSVSMAQATAKRKNMTTLSFSAEHGNQISFSRADGQIFLWYPGNPAILQGEWRACEDQFSINVKGGDHTYITYGKLCFRYGADTVNPATGAKGAIWECVAASTLEASRVDTRGGDIFGLEKLKTVPFALPAEKTTLAACLAECPKEGANQQRKAARVERGGFFAVSQRGSS